MNDKTKMYDMFDKLEYDHALKTLKAKAPKSFYDNDGVLDIAHFTKLLYAHASITGLDLSAQAGDVTVSWEKTDGCVFVLTVSCCQRSVYIACGTGARANYVFVNKSRARVIKRDQKASVVELVPRQHHVGMLFDAIFTELTGVQTMVGIDDPCYSTLALPKTHPDVTRIVKAFSRSTDDRKHILNGMRRCAMRDIQFGIDRVLLSFK